MPSWPSSIPGKPVLFRGQQVVNARAAGRARWPSGIAALRRPQPAPRPISCSRRSCALAGARRAGGHPHRRRRHAGGDLAAQQLLRPGRLRRRLRHPQQRADRRRRAGRRQRAHPDRHHVQGHEPLAGQRALQRLRRRRAGRRGPEAEGEASPITPEDAYFILEAARSVVFVPGYGMAVAQAQHAVARTGRAARAERRRGAATPSTPWPAACPAT